MSNGPYPAGPVGFLPAGLVGGLVTKAGSRVVPPPPKQGYPGHPPTAWQWGGTYPPGKVVPPKAQPFHPGFQSHGFIPQAFQGMVPQNRGISLKRFLDTNQDVNMLTPGLCQEMVDHLQYLHDSNWPTEEPIFTAAYQDEGDESFPGHATSTTTTAPDPEILEGFDDGDSSSESCGEMLALQDVADEPEQDCSDLVARLGEAHAALAAAADVTDEVHTAVVTTSDMNGDNPTTERPTANSSTQPSDVDMNAADQQSHESASTAEQAQQNAESSSSSAAAGKVKRTTIIAPSFREGALAAAELMMKRRLLSAKEGERVELHLRQLRYCQDSIMGKFRDGRPVNVMREELAQGKKSIQEIPIISAVVANNTVYTADNRRLWTFKHSGMPGNTRISVIAAKSDHKFVNKFTTPTKGLTLHKRGSDGFG